MYKKLSQLGFVIGLFFLIISLVMLLNSLLGQARDRLSILTAIIFLLFGLGMMFFGKGRESD